MGDQSARRYSDGRPHEAVETEALRQTVLVDILRTRLDELLRGYRWFRSVNVIPIEQWRRKKRVARPQTQTLLD